MGEKRNNFHKTKTDSKIWQGKDFFLHEAKVAEKTGIV